MQYQISEKQIAKLLDIFINADGGEVIRFKKLSDGQSVTMFLLNKKGVVCKGCREKGLDICDHITVNADEWEHGSRTIKIDILSRQAEMVEKEEENGQSQESVMPIAESDPDAVVKKDKFYGRIATLSKDPYGDWGNFVGPEGDAEDDD